MRETFMLPHLCGDNGDLATGVAKQGASSWLWYSFQRHLQACVPSPTVYLPKCWQRGCKIPTKRSSSALGRGQLTVPTVCVHPATSNPPHFTKGSGSDEHILVPMPRLLMHTGWWPPEHVSLLSCSWCSEGGNFPHSRRHLTLSSAHSLCGHGEWLEVGLEPSKPV